MLKRISTVYTLRGLAWVFNSDRLYEEADWFDEYYSKRGDEFAK